jgi:UDP-N-acetylglucosamine 2-epimerase (non-hydrolysing)
MRDSTERPEGIIAGTVKLVGTSKELIEEEVSNLIENKYIYEQMSKAKNPYGEGNSSEKIVRILSNLYYKK